MGASKHTKHGWDKENWDKKDYSYYKKEMRGYKSPYVGTKPDDKQGLESVLFYNGRGYNSEIRNHQK